MLSSPALCTPLIFSKKLILNQRPTYFHPIVFIKRKKKHDDGYPIGVDHYKKIKSRLAAQIIALIRLIKRVLYANSDPCQRLRYILIFWHQIQQILIFNQYHLFKHHNHSYSDNPYFIYRLFFFAPYYYNNKEPTIDELQRYSDRGTLLIGTYDNVIPPPIIRGGQRSTIHFYLKPTRHWLKKI